LVPKKEAEPSNHYVTFRLALPFQLVTLRKSFAACGDRAGEGLPFGIAQTDALYLDPRPV
jgi:hypothetical protein